MKTFIPNTVRIVADVTAFNFYQASVGGLVLTAAGGEKVSLFGGVVEINAFSSLSDWKGMISSTSDRMTSSVKDPGMWGFGAGVMFFNPVLSSVLQKYIPVLSPVMKALSANENIAGGLLSRGMAGRIQGFIVEEGIKEALPEKVMKGVGLGDTLASEVFQEMFDKRGGMRMANTKSNFASVQSKYDGVFSVMANNASSYSPNAENVVNAVSTALQEAPTTIRSSINDLLTAKPDAIARADQSSLGVPGGLTETGHAVTGTAPASETAGSPVNLRAEGEGSFSTVGRSLGTEQGNNVEFAGLAVMLSASDTEMQQALYNLAAGPMEGAGSFREVSDYLESARDVINTAGVARTDLLSAAREGAGQFLAAVANNTPAFVNSAQGVAVLTRFVQESLATVGYEGNGKTFDKLISALSNVSASVASTESLTALTNLTAQLLYKDGPENMPLGTINNLTYGLLSGISNLMDSPTLETELAEKNEGTLNAATALKVLTLQIDQQPMISFKARWAEVIGQHQSLLARTSEPATNIFDLFLLQTAANLDQSDLQKAVRELPKNARAQDLANSLRLLHGVRTQVLGLGVDELPGAPADPILKSIYERDIALVAHLRTLGGEALLKQVLAQPLKKLEVLAGNDSTEKIRFLFNAGLPTVRSMETIADRNTVLALKTTKLLGFGANKFALASGAGLAVTTVASALAMPLGMATAPLLAAAAAASYSLVAMGVGMAADWTHGQFS
ncbi:MAG TPA: hypothetical protein PK362_06265, partial [Elusimicrobiota bacterium]|nr:hypothetical protein [Elusimicrobiota bacterium]